MPRIDDKISSMCQGNFFYFQLEVIKKSTCHKIAKKKISQNHKSCCNPVTFQKQDPVMDLLIQRGQYEFLSL